MTKKIICIAILVCLVGVFAAGCGFKKKCTLKVTTSYGGTDEAGQQLPGGSFEEILEVKEGDTVYENFSGKYSTKGDAMEKSFTIKKIDTESVTFVSGDQEITLSYGEKADRPSIIFVADGANYFHKIVFEK